MRRSPRRGDAGETLVELMMTITIVSVAFVLVITAILFSVRSSTSDQRGVRVDRMLTRWAEALDLKPYVPCAGAATLQSTYPPSDPSILGTDVTGYTASYASASYWDGANWKADNCGSPADTTLDKGIQRVQLQIQAPDGQWPGFTRTLWVTLRKPCLPGGTPLC